MTQRAARTIGGVAAAVLVVGMTARAGDIKSVTKAIFAVPSTTGNEHELAAKIRGLLPKTAVVEDDALGTVAVRLGGSTGPTLVLAALDGYGHMVSGITPDGYLTVDRPVAPPHPRFDGYLLGQPVVVSTARGPVAGVVSQPALHLLTQERRKLLVEGFSLETAFIDIGVRSDKEARAKGVEILDPVTYPAVLTELAGGHWAGPSLGQKAVAAVLVDAVAEAAAAGKGTVVAWAAQTKFTIRGRGARPALGAARARTKWQPERAVIVDVVAAGKGDGFPFPGGGPVLIQAKDAETPLRQALVKLAGEAKVTLQVLAAADSSLALPFSLAPSEVLTVALPVLFLNTPSEVIDLADLQALRDLLAAYLAKGAGQ